MLIDKKEKERCSVCRMYKSFCFCSSLKSKIKMSTRITILMHIKEYDRLTNTGRLATLCLENASIIVRGAKDTFVSKEDIILEGYDNRILFPYASEELSKTIKSADSKPLHLIVPDGTWGQAKKLVISEDFLLHTQRIKLPAVNPSEYILRKSHDVAHLSTIEAVARALGIVENIHVQEEIERVFIAMRTNLLLLRGY